VIPRSLVIGVAAMLVVVVAMGTYVRRMRRQAADFQYAAGLQPVAPPPSGPTETVTLYIADDAAGTLRPQSAQIPLPGGRQQRAEELLRALLRIYQQPGAAVIDLNTAFADQHRSGILDEQLTINSLVETLAVNVPGVNRVRILVEGNARETLAGHADLTDFFDARTIVQSTH
jgi:hypothetical protein